MSMMAMKTGVRRGPSRYSGTKANTTWISTHIASKKKFCKGGGQVAVLLEAWFIRDIVVIFALLCFSHLSRHWPRGYLEYAEYEVDAEEERAEEREHREAVPHQQLQIQFV